MTQQELLQRYNQFVADWLGKQIEAEDLSNLYQCMDEIFKYCDYLGIPREAVRHFYAYQVFTQPNDTTRKYFDIIYNGPNNIAPEGAIAVFDQKVGYAGHVSIVKKDSTSQNLVSYDQNWNGLLYMRQITHYNYYGVMGWLVPKVQPINWDMKVDQVKNVVNGGDTSENKIKNIQKIVNN